MVTILEYIRDVMGNNYVGVNIYNDSVYQFLDELKEILGDEYDTYIRNQQNRDNGHYHITVINVMEYNKLCKEHGIDKVVNSLEEIFKQEIRFTMMGLGKAEKNGNTAYFVVVKSEDLEEIRKKYDLPEFDFHITLGYQWKDVFGVRKNQVLPKYSSFLKLLKKEYYKKNESFSFVKELENFDGDVEKDVEPVEILDTYATFRIGENRYFSISIIGDKLMVSAKWEDNKKIPAIPFTIVARKLKDKK